jgi:hypothetical protein
VIFNFVVMSDYENISTTKISGFMVITEGHSYTHGGHMHSRRLCVCVGVWVGGAEKKRER